MVNKISLKITLTIFLNFSVLLVPALNPSIKVIESRLEKVATILLSLLRSTIFPVKPPPDVISLPSPEDLYATIIHPKIELRTADARSVLKKTISLEKGIQQWGNLAALVSALYTNDYDLISRSLVDVVIEPERSVLIPHFNEMKKAALSAGALGSGISGSGPSIFTLSKGHTTAEKVQQALIETFSPLGIEFDTFVSKINPKGVQIIS